MQFMGIDVYLYTESPYSNNLFVFLINHCADFEGQPQACIGKYGAENKVVIHVNNAFLNQAFNLQIAVLCHEVGHYSMGHLGPCGELSDTDIARREIEADYFAAECGFSDELISDMREKKTKMCMIRVKALEEWNGLDRLSNVKQTREIIMAEALVGGQINNQTAKSSETIT